MIKFGKTNFPTVVVPDFQLIAYSIDKQILLCKTYFAPIESIVQMNGLSSSPNPAITGWQKYGPNLKRMIKALRFCISQFQSIE